MSRCGALCGFWHVLGCSGHPFNPGYNRTGWLSEDGLVKARVNATRSMYAADVIDAAEMDRRIEVAVRGGDLEGDLMRP